MSSNTDIEVKEVKKRAKKEKRQYFTKETENAIIQYNLCEDDLTRNQIYNDKIKYPFEKLVENIIHTFKFYHFDVPYEDVKNEVIAFLNEKIHKYTDPEKGKAFSYFSIIAKNYLIVHNNNNYHKFKNCEQPESIDLSRDLTYEVHREYEINDMREFMDLFIEHMDENLSEYFKKPADLTIADSVLELFKRRDNIETFNKKALYIMIRERTGVKTEYITRVVNVIKTLYTDMFLQYKKTGRINTVSNKFSDFMI
jgi:hypothetical protein